MSDTRPLPPVLLWTAEEVAYAVAVGVEVIEAKRKAGEITAVKVGRAWRYHPEDVQAWINGLRPATAPDTADYYSVNGVMYRTPQAGTRAG
jgi:excisionase family DNA binding protein